MSSKNVLIKIQNVDKLYLHKKKKKISLKAVNNVSLELYEGEVFGLLGVNGAGKTTLSSIISTLIKPTSGDILWKGKSIYKDLYNYRKIIGFCPQKQNLDENLTLEQNLIFQGRYYGMNVSDIKSRIEYLNKKFGFEKYIKLKADILSGGYRQRFLIARSLMHSPKFLILDEPTVGLDPHIRRKLWDTINLLKNEGMTIVLTTHYLDEAEQLSDRVCVINDGKVLLTDTPENLLLDLKKKNLEDVFLHLIKEQEAE
jgi:ABC-2 type transport system ATP-binding protein